jgi:hypothetical protein
MFRFLADENFSGDIVRGLFLRQPTLDIVRVQDIAIAGMHDPAILTWAAENDRIVLTHDRATMPKFAYERVVAGSKMPGVFALSDRFPAGLAVQEIPPHRRMH